MHQQSSQGKAFEHSLYRGEGEAMILDVNHMCDGRSVQH